MPIIKNIETPNKVSTEYQVIKNCDINLLTGLVNLTILSYTNQSAYISGVGSAWTHYVQIDVLDIEGESCGIKESIEKFLISQSNGLFYQGTSVEDVSESLESFKNRVWNKVKDKRDSYEYGGFNSRFGRFDSDEDSVRRIAGAATAAIIEKNLGNEWSIDWTLANNDTVSLTLDDVLEVAVTAVAHVNQTHEFARQLRIKIDLAMTKSELDEILSEEWPADLNKISISEV